MANAQQPILKIQSTISDFSQKCREKAVKLRNEPMFTDAILAIGNDRFQVHKIILASASSYFENLFRNKPRNDDIIRLDGNGKELPVEIFRLILDFIYESRITITFQNALDLNFFADKFSLNDLKKETLSVLEKNLSAATCLDYWHHAETIRDKGLEKRCFDYILNNPYDFFQSSLKDLQPPEFIRIVKNLKCDHELILRNIMIWIKQEFDQRKFDASELLAEIQVEKLSDDIIRELENDSKLKHVKEFIELGKNYYKANRESVNLR